MSKDDPEYLAKRAKNNEAIKKSREKARLKANETKDRVANLKADNKRLEDQISVLGQEMKFLKDILVAHASGSKASSTVTSEPDSTSTAGGETIKPEGEKDQIPILDLLETIEDFVPSSSGS